MFLDPSLYSYSLPSELIASRPAEPRDSARLFVYDTKTDTISYDIFKNICKYLPSPSLIVLNDTKVVPARVFLKKESGGRVEVLFLTNEIRSEERVVRGLADRGLSVGQTLSAKSGEQFKVVGQEENIFVFEPLFSIKDMTDFLIRQGETPIPKYIKGNILPEGMLRERYQSIFAKDGASVAAPTASLHFTDSVRDSFSGKGIGEAFVRLHVGLGTFAPVTPSHVSSGTLHTESYDMSYENKERIVSAKRKGEKIIAVGTTVVRALESAKNYIFDEKEKDSISGETNIFIRPPFQFQVADILITNFHVPESSLMMLVEAFLQNKGAKRRLVELYKEAIREKFRFYSFGDAMLIV